MSSHAFLISAAHKSSGKTTVSIGLARALARRGLAVRPGKKGPDYIDPNWLSAAAGAPCYNYDFNTQSSDEITELFAAGAADVRMLEGNKGLYDAVDTDGSNSNAALARLLGIPVVLVIDCEGITRGVAPLLCGYRDFEPIEIAGVVLNKVAGDRHEGKLRAAVEMYTDIPVLGAVRRSADLVIGERHLGLVPGNEHPAREAVIERIADAIRDQVDLDLLLSRTAGRELPVALPGTLVKAAGLTVAVARDEAFGFYYADDLEYLERRGGRIAWFSPIHDGELPRADALFLGGGFPENFAAELAANASMRRQVADFAAGNGVIYAECGGLMYLCRELQVDGVSYPMAGVVEAAAVMRSRPCGRGLVQARANRAHPWFAGLQAPPPFSAHEFHYSELIGLPRDSRTAFDILRGQGLGGGRDGVVIGNTLATYVHQRHTRSNPWIDGFVRYIQTRNEERS